MWISWRFLFSGATVSGVTTKARTPSIVVFSTLTLSRSSMPGTFLISAAAPASATGFHSSPVLGWISQFDRSGAPMIFCNWGLTVVGTGMVWAGTSMAAGAAVCATAFLVVRDAA